MSRVTAIAVNTFRETIRDRILGVIVLFALAMIVASLWLASISLGQEARMMKDFGLVAVSAFGLIVAVFVAASLVRKEVEKRTVFMLFSKPVDARRVHLGQVRRLRRDHGRRRGRHGRSSSSLSRGSSRDRRRARSSSPARSSTCSSLVVMVVTILFSTLTSAILASVLGICVYAAGQLSHNVLSLTRSATVRCCRPRPGWSSTSSPT